MREGGGERKRNFFFDVHYFLTLFRLTGDDREVQLLCAKAWTAWELSMVGLIPNPAMLHTKVQDEEWMINRAMIER